MPDRTGIFAGAEPFGIARRWLDEAAASEPEDANAAALATVGADGLPNVRMVLLKGLDRNGFTFFTNYGSVKGRELEALPGAAMVFHWKSLRRQLRLRGRVDREDGREADSYFASRSPGSRIGAWASHQSRPLASRAALEAAVAAEAARRGDVPDRPPFWGGFRIVPVEIEFWADGAFRLHDRFRWSRAAPGGDWSVERLFP